jgi:adenosylhomocysteine nucleosidase
MRLGLVVALPEEARALARVISGARREEAAGSGPASAAPHLLTGTLAGQPVLVGWAGAGAGCAARAAMALLERRAEGLLAVGFAGALSPSLCPGDLLAATAVTEPGGGCWSADAGWLAALEGVAAENDGCLMGAPSVIIARPNHPRTGVDPRLHRGQLVTASGVVTAAAEKRRLREETGALAVDMESAAVARCAATAGVPMLALRAITDAADESLPLDFELCFDSHGQFHRARLIGLLARRPFALGGLIRLGRHSAQAGRALASFLACHLPRLVR